VRPLSLEKNVRHENVKIHPQSVTPRTHGCHCKEFTDAMDNLPYALENLSAGRMVVDKIDTFIIDEPVKTVSGSNGAFVPEKDLDIDKYLAGNDYSQILVRGKNAECRT
jgi:hypothetical protein